MKKNGNENAGGRFLSGVARVITKTSNAARAAITSHRRLSHWRPASTAPCNQDVELRVAEDSVVTTLPFPCRHTNGGEWINVDLGVRLQIEPVEWRAWQQSKSPHPHQSWIFALDEAAMRRREQWGGCHADAEWTPLGSRSEALTCKR